VADESRKYLHHADEDLMGLVEVGDAEAFAALYDRHGRMAYSLAYRMMGEKQEAEDVVQEAFIKVWRSAGGSHARRGSMQEKVEASAPISEPSEAFAETWKNAQQEQVREALNTIPHEQLKILELAYFSGYTHVEIAERLELPLGTVKGRMRLGLQKLRDYYQARGAAVPR
jgi:RNA polymerase sigma-70 factor, ECF subfamily